MVENITNATSFHQRECPDFTDGDGLMLKHVSFWVEGTLSCSIAMAGFVGNVGSSVILSAKGKTQRGCSGALFS